MARKTVLITGGNSGIGLAIAHEAAARGARVCIASRDQQKSAAAKAAIEKAVPGAEVETFRLDLGSLEAIRAFAAEFLQKHPVLDVLVNNAGTNLETQKFTADGYEMQFGGNYLGPFLLTHLLLPALENADDGRIVHMASMIHLIGRIDESTFRGRKPYIGVMAYAQSKLGNILFSHALARRLASRGITSNAMHPGGVNTNIYDDLPGWISGALRPFLIGPDKAAKLACDFALAPEHRQTTGTYRTVQPPSFQSRKARNVELQEWLYAESCRLAGVTPLPTP
ncbi:MAG: SDR family NAD(P)-dependent oxidoreductase [Pseudomonadota bacterium]